eukprot:8510140-Karenia_brevis.AAC.1
MQCAGTKDSDSYRRVCAACKVASEESLDISPGEARLRWSKRFACTLRYHSSRCPPSEKTFSRLTDALFLSPLRVAICCAKHSRKRACSKKTK